MPSNCGEHGPSEAAAAPGAAVATAPSSAAAAVLLSDGRWSCSQTLKRESWVRNKRWSCMLRWQKGTESKQAGRQQHTYTHTKALHTRNSTAVFSFWNINNQSGILWNINPLEEKELDNVSTKKHYSCSVTKLTSLPHATHINGHAIHIN